MHKEELFLKSITYNQSQIKDKNKYPFNIPVVKN